MKTKYVPYIKSMYCIGRYQRKIFFAYWAKKNEPKIVRLKVNQNYLPMFTRQLTVWPSQGRWHFVNAICEIIQIQFEWNKIEVEG